MSDAGSGPVDRPALSRLIPHSPERFANEWWGRQPLLSGRRGVSPKGGENSATRADLDVDREFGDLFSIEAADELIANGALRTPFVRMANEGTVLKPDEYTSSGGFGAEVADQLDSAKVLHKFSEGSTLVLQGLHRTWPAIADFTRQLVIDLGHPCQVNAYITPASSRGFDPHYDVHDVFVIQVHGEKAWRIHEPVHPDPLRNQPWSDHRQAVAAQAEGEPFIDQTFRPGDVLYLPRGWIHSATALRGTSIHLTIGVAAYTRYDIVERVLAGAAQDEKLRSSLPMGIDFAQPEALRAIVEQTIADLSAQFGSRDFSEEVSADLSRRFNASTPPAPVRPLMTVESLAALDAETVVTLRAGLDARVEHDDTQVRIVLRTKTIAFPVEAAPAITALLAGEPTCAGRLAGLDADSSLVVARRLVREAVAIVQ